MLLLTGPAGSGKTFHVVGRFRDALRRNDSTVRLLVPTATMAQHLQNRFAREGFVFRPGLIQTLSRFVDTFVEDLPQVSDSAFYLIVEEAALRANRPEFAAVVRLPGFCASLARGIAELSAAGCGAERLAGNLPGAPLAEAFLAIYRGVERDLAGRGVAMRADRLARAAARIAESGMPGVSTVWIDGFHALPDPDLGVIAAMWRRADLTLTLATGDATEATRARLLAAGFEERTCARRRPQPPVDVVEASSLERECEEIARRILGEAARRRPFREMGVVVRSPEVYEPVLRATFERFGIPARFYFDQELSRHPAARLPAGAVDAMLGGWDYEATLAALRPARQSASMDRFDFMVRERMPGRGLEGLRELAGGDAGVLRLLDGLAELEGWRELRLTPREWAERVAGLRRLFRAARPKDGVPHAAAEVWRGQAAAMAAFEEAARSVGQALPDGAIALAEFWRAFKSILRLTPLRAAGQRRDVVHVIGAHEARQWELPVVFVCGLVERHFPRLHRQDPFFPEGARRRLAQAGIRIRTAAEFECEERALFDSAVTRSTALTVLSYPRFDAAGEQNLRSLFLAGLAPGSTPPAVRPLPRSVRVGRRPTAALRSPDLLEHIAARTGTLSPTALETYLKCPFSFFAEKLLRLEPPPVRPEQRFDFLVQGNVAHAVLAEWHRERQPLEPLFARVFGEVCAEHNVPSGYRTEMLRHRILQDLLAYVAEPRDVRGGETRTEESFTYPLDGTLAISGRIDRLDVAPDGRAWVVDYKYSSAQNTRERVKNEDLLQAPLYILAVERAFGLEPAAMHYCGLRGGVTMAGWDAPFPEGWLDTAARRSVEAAARIRGGDFAPAGEDGCRWCCNRDVCRYDPAAVVTIAEGA